MKNLNRKLLFIIVAIVIVSCIIPITIFASSTPDFRGDMNGDGAVNYGDAIYLLRYTFMPDKYPISTEYADANGDGVKNSEDAIYLLLHTNAPNKYPITSKEEVYSQGLEYTLSDDGTYYIVSGLGSCRDENIIIPESYNEKPITSIGKEAFRRKFGPITYRTVKISKTISDISSNAFNWSFVSKIEVVSDNPYYKSIDGNLYTNDGKTLLRYADGRWNEHFDIPDGVTAIGENAFYLNYSLKDITVPNSVKSIGNFAFSGCDELTNIELSDGLISIGNSAFSSCEKLVNINIPNTVTSIGSSAFFNCEKLVSLEIPDGVTVIENRLCAQCTDLKTIKLPNSIQKIEEDAFTLCENLSTIEIPSGVTVIGKRIFEGCSSLLQIIVADNNSNYKSIDGNLYTKDGKTIIHYASGKEDTYFKIPDSVEYIDKYSFYTEGDLTTIDIPKSVTFIGSYAWGSHIKNIIFNGTRDEWESAIKTSWGLAVNNITFLGKSQGLTYTLSNNGLSYIVSRRGSCTDRYIVIPSEYNSLPVTAIDASAFYDTNIYSVDIPDTVTEIGEKAFGSCDSLSEVIFGNNIERIEDSAFLSCKRLYNIELPNTIKHIGQWGFAGTGYYNKTENWDNDVLYIGNYLIQAGNIDIDSYEIRQGTICIADGAFQHQTTIQNFEVPDSVKYVGKYAFDNTGYYNNAENWEDGVLYAGKCLIKAKYNNGANYIIKPNTVCIADEAFKDSYYFSIHIPDTVVYIGDLAFSCCNLSEIIIPGDIEYIGKRFLFYNYFLERISINGNNDFYKSDGNCLIDIRNKTLLTGCINSVIPSDGSVVCIEDYAFYRSELQNIVIPNTVRYIGNNAFDSSSLQNLFISDGLIHIAREAFYDCNELEMVVLSNTIQYIGEYAFPSAYYCDLSVYYTGTMDDYRNIYFGTMERPFKESIYFYSDKKPTQDGYYWHYVDNIPTVWDYYENSGLEYTLSFDRDCYFVDCNHTTENIVISSYWNGLPVELTYSNFNGDSHIIVWDDNHCNHLRHVEIKNGINEISWSCFEDCINLESVIIPFTVTEIGYDAFRNCKNLKNIFFEGNEADWNAIKKGDDWDYNTGNYNITYCYLTETNTDFDILHLPVSQKEIMLIPLNGEGKYMISDRVSGTIISWSNPNLYYEIINTSGEVGMFSINENGMLFGEKGGLVRFNIYYIYDGESVCVLENQLAFVAESSLINSDSVSTFSNRAPQTSAKFSDSDKKYISMCLDLTYALPNVKSPSLPDLGIFGIDQVWMGVSNLTENIAAFIRDPLRYSATKEELKRNLAGIVQNYVDETKPPKEALSHADSMLKLLNYLLRLDENSAQYKSLSTEEQVKLKQIQKAENSEIMLKALSEFLNLYMLNGDIKELLEDIDAIETLDDIQEVAANVRSFAEYTKDTGLDTLLGVVLDIEGITVDALLYMFYDYEANIEVLKLLREELITVYNSDEVIILAIDELIADYTDVWKSGLEKWGSNIAAMTITTIAEYAITFKFSQFGLVAFIVESFADCSYAQEKSQLYTLALISSALYDSLDPLRDMYMNGKQTIPLDRLETLVSLYLYLVRDENKLAWTLWFDYSMDEIGQFGRTTNYIENTLGIYLK